MTRQKKKTRILIIDDSAVVRTTLTEIFEEDPDLEVMATAADPYVAVERIKREVPDVITLDVEMPRMDGVTFLRKLMSQHPIPVVMCSSLTEKSSRTAMEALEVGAVEVFEKPRIGARQHLEETKVRLIDIVKSAGMANVRNVKRAASPLKPRPKLDADVVMPRAGAKAMTQTTETIIAVGASTGGCQALTLFLGQLPIDCSGVVVVQHMPEKFTASFAQTLDGKCAISVKEAEDNDSVVPGHALIAPGNRHLLLKRSGARYYVETKMGPLVSRHRPSVDVLFRSVARYAGVNAVGVIMTGMGDDGAKGMLEMKEAGARTIAQDKESCVVFGMPAEAIKLGGVDETLPLERLAAGAIAASASRPKRMSNNI